MAQANYWILTIPHANFLPYLPPNCSYIKGQLELGRRRRRLAEEETEESGYLHWQLVAYFTKKVRLGGVTSTFGPWHAEPTKSRAANDYVWKDDTSIEGTRFELGNLPINRSSPKDWDGILSHAKAGTFELIPSDIVVRCYNQLRRIEADSLSPRPIVRTVFCYWGRTGSGKSRRAWGEAGNDAYPKNSRTKFWDGYRGHKNVVMDEFRGCIDIANLLIWLDRYPCIVEMKGTSTVLKAEKIWITSNLHPYKWYPDLDKETMDALIRRMEIIEFE